MQRLVGSTALTLLTKSHTSSVHCSLKETLVLPNGRTPPRNCVRLLQSLEGALREHHPMQRRLYVQRISLLDSRALFTRSEINMKKLLLPLFQKSATFPYFSWSRTAQHPYYYGYIRSGRIHKIPITIGSGSRVCRSFIRSLNLSLDMWDSLYLLLP